MNTCPCCSGLLLRHIRHNNVYWFCQHCWQEMPDLSLETLHLQRVASKPLGLAEMLTAR